jgi:hypothetical protein
VNARRSRLEIPIQADIEAAIGAEPDLLLLRNSVGKATYYTDKGSAYHVPYGLGNGSPDLVGILAPHGRWLCFEVKAQEGHLNVDQAKCHAVWRRFGALIYVVRSVEEARAALEDARKQ